jgi:hypothetical protein
MTDKFENATPEHDFKRRSPSKASHEFRLAAWKERQRLAACRMVANAPSGTVTCADEPGPPGGCIE